VRKFVPRRKYSRGSGAPDSSSDLDEPRGSQVDRRLPGIAREVLNHKQYEVFDRSRNVGLDDGDMSNRARWSKHHADRLYRPTQIAAQTKGYWSGRDFTARTKRRDNSEGCSSDDGKGRRPRRELDDGQGETQVEVRPGARSVTTTTQAQGGRGGEVSIGTEMITEDAQEARMVVEVIPVPPTVIASQNVKAINTLGQKTGTACLGRNG
jgi:hypothetical protein